MARVAIVTGGGTGLSYTPDPDYAGADSFRYVAFTYIPVWILALLFAFDVVVAFLLLAQYRIGGGPRLLVLSCAFTWSAAVPAPNFMPSSAFRRACRLASNASGLSPAPGVRHAKPITAIGTDSGLSCCRVAPALPARSCAFSAFRRRISARALAMTSSSPIPVLLVASLVTAVSSPTRHRCPIECSQATREFSSDYLSAARPPG